MANKKIAGITVEINGDTTKLGKSLQDTENKMKGVKDELKQINSALKLDPKNTELLAQKQQVLADAIKVSKERLDKLKEAQTQIEQKFKSGEIDDGQYRAFKREVEKAKEELQYYQNEADKSKESSQKLGKKVGEVKQDFKETGEEMKKAGDSVSAFGDKIENVGEKAAIASGIIVGAAAASYKAWEEVDEGYDTIIKKTGATGDKLQGLQDVANNIFTSLPVDMAKVGTAVGEVNTRFGLVGDELEKLTTKFIKYSEITGTDVNTSIDSISASVRAFGLDTSKTGDVLDKIASISQRTGISTSTLESSLATNAAIFKEMGLSIGEGAELLGQFEINGVDTSTALASLKKAQQNATKSGQTLSEALKKNITDIKNAKTEAEALSIATELFGTKGALTMTQAIREGRTELEDLDSTLYDTKDTVNNTFEATLDAPDKLKVAINQVKVEAADLAAIAMDKLAPALKKVTDKVKELTQKFNELSDEQKTKILKGAAIVASISPVLIIIGKLTSAVGGLISTLSGITAFLATNPAVAAVIGIGLVIGALALLYQNCEEFRDFADETIAEFKEIFAELGNEIQDLITETKQWAEENQDIMETAKDIIKYVAIVIRTYLIKSIQDLAKGFVFAWTWISETWKVAVRFFQTLIDNIFTIFSVVEDVLTGDFSAAWEGIKKIFANTGQFFQQLIDSIKNIVGGIGKFWYDTFSIAAGYVVDVIRPLNSFFADVIEGMVNTLKSLPDKVGDVLNQILQKIRQFVDDAGNVLSKIDDKLGVFGDIASFTSGGLLGLGVKKVSKYLPFFAGGGTLDKNGEMAIVGDAGPELLRLYNGKAIVTPLNGNTTSSTPVSSSTTTSNRVVNNYNIYVKSFAKPEDARTTSQMLGKLQQQEDFGKGLA